MSKIVYTAVKQQLLTSRTMIFVLYTCYEEMEIHWYVLVNQNGHHIKLIVHTLVPLRLKRKTVKLNLN